LDEAGQFIPSALDILHGGAFIPHSATPNIHPPAVVAYLAAVWSLAGYSRLKARNPRDAPCCCWPPVA
jgi:hypothetical protein